MIEKLNGIHETVIYRSEAPIQLYLNDTSENYPPHWHLPFELIMPLKNGYDVICNRTEYHLKEQDILIIFPGTLHEMTAPKEVSRIIFQASIPSIVRKELDHMLSFLSPAVLITPETFPAIHPVIRDEIMKIYKEYTERPLYYQTFIFSSFFQILGLIGRHHADVSTRILASSVNKQHEYIQKFLSVTDYINTHFSENLTLEQIASMAGFSKYHFSRLFRQYADTSFYKYLNQKRISYSQELLMNPELSVTEVGLQSGFTSLSAFLRMFRLINNCTPSEFRMLCDRDSRPEL